MSATIPQWRPAEARAWMAEHEPEDYLVLDVRQPAEFDRGHLPGALLLPLPELPFRLDEVPRDRRVITVCHAGMRSMSAALQLRAAGWDDVVNLAGGIAAWDGAVAYATSGLAEALFRPADGPEALRAAAAAMERATETFYRRAAERLREAGDAPAAALFEGLAREEAAHAGALDETGSAGEGAFAEGGFPLADLLGWLAAGRPAEAILDLALAMEATAFDRYARLLRAEPAPEVRALLERLAAAEHRHMNELARLRELQASRS